MEQDQQTYYETELQHEVDNFQPQKAIDTVLDFIVVVTLGVCLIMAFLNVTEGIWEEHIKRLFKKK